jgi:hypothetical protein
MTQTTGSLGMPHRTKPIDAAEQKTLQNLIFDASGEISRFKRLDTISSIRRDGEETHETGFGGPGLHLPVGRRRLHRHQQMGHPTRNAEPL